MQTSDWVAPPLLQNSICAASRLCEYRHRSAVAALMFICHIQKPCTICVPHGDWNMISIIFTDNHRQVEIQLGCAEIAKLHSHIYYMYSSLECVKIIIVFLSVCWTSLIKPQIKMQLHCPSRTQIPHHRRRHRANHMLDHTCIWCGVLNAHAAYYV